MSRSSRTRRTTPAGLGAILALALVLPACTGPDDGGDDDGTGSDVEALAEEVAGLGAADLEARLAAEASAVEHELLAISGLAEELGGPEAAAESYDAMVAALTEAGRRSPSTRGTWGSRRPRRRGWWSGGWS